MFDDEKPPLDDDLLMHYGVPGMRWGRRKNNMLESSKRIQTGNATLRDKARVYNHMGVQNLVTKKRRQKAVAKRVVKLTDQKKRVESGHATVRDNLSMAFNTKLSDIVKPISK